MAKLSFYLKGNRKWPNNGDYAKAVNGGKLNHMQKLKMPQWDCV
jgi:hypothetical protein